MGRIEIALQRGSALQMYQAMWGPLYEAVLNILGSTAVVLPVGDPKHGQPNATTFTTVGEEQVTFTWSEAPASFDSALDLTDPDSFQGIVPVIDFNGSDEEADSPDAAYWSRDDSSGEAMSCGAWVQLDSAGSFVVLGKFSNSDTVREWQFETASGAPALRVYDQSASVGGTRTADSAISAGVWVFIVATYDGTGGADAMGTSGSTQDNATIYVDGAIVASTAADNGSYVAMEDLGAVVSLAHQSAGSASTASFFDGKIAGGPLGPFFAQNELTPDEVRRLYEVGRRALAV